MKTPVRITAYAQRDLEEIYTWIAEHDSEAHANHVLDRLSEAAESIARFPRRGSRPDELPEGMSGEFRQIFFKPYRVIYEVLPEQAVIHLIADGRRSLQSLLLRRLTSR